MESVNHAPFHVNGNEIIVHVICGIAWNLENALLEADIALKQAKKNRRDYVVNKESANIKQELQKTGVDQRVIMRIEEGHLGVGIGAYVAALWAMGLHQDVSYLASPQRDQEGQTLAAARRGDRVRPATELDDEF